MPLSAKQTLIIGLGKTGLSCAHFLAEQGIEIAVTDTRTHPPGLKDLQETLPDVAVFVGGFNEQAFNSADCLVVSPGISLQEPLIAKEIDRGVEVIGDMELFSRVAAAPIIAITGSNGKSTVTTLLGQMAQSAGIKVAIGGNIGTPVLELLKEEPELYVIEVSSFQLETTTNLNTLAAVILNLCEDHMDRYESMNDYAASKAKVYAGGGAVIVNLDDPRVAEIAESFSAGRTVVPFSVQLATDNGFCVCHQQDKDWLCKGEQPLLAVSQLKIRGQHNIANALAALALGDTAGIPMPAMLETLRNFSGLSHRCQWVAEKDGITWYNDSKATNVGAALAAINGISAGKLILIAGGQAKGQDFSVLKSSIAEHVRVVILIGEDAYQIEQALADSAPIIHTGSMREAVMHAEKLAQPGDAVLLSPACASFDMFSGFEERGKIFMEAVRELLA